MVDAKTLREQILKLAREYYQIGHIKKKWEPGMRIPYSARVYDADEIEALVDSSLEFWLTAGRFHEQFEKNLAEFMNQKFALAVNSGSSANLVALTALTSPLLKDTRVKQGDEVITCATSFPTTVNPIVQNGCVPVFLDAEIGTYNMDLSMLEDAIGEKTKAIMLAHTLGNPSDLDKVSAVCKKHGLFLIEDCCDAFGARWDGKIVGTFGDLATLSFYPAHHITTGEGGAVLTSKPLLKKAAMSIRDWGRDCWCKPGEADTCKMRFKWKLGDLPYGYDHKYIYSHIGYNLKITDMQAAVGVKQLEKAPKFIEARRRNHTYLLKRMREVEDYFVLPKELEKAQASWFGFALTIREDAGFSRQDIVEYLEGRGISTRMVFAGNIVRQPAYADVKSRIVGDLSGADKIMNNTFWIGVYPGLSDEQLEYMADEIIKFAKKAMK